MDYRLPRNGLSVVSQSILHYNTIQHWLHPNLSSSFVLKLQTVVFQLFIYSTENRVFRPDFRFLDFHSILASVQWIIMQVQGYENYLESPHFSLFLLFFSSTLATPSIMPKCSLMTVSCGAFSKLLKSVSLRENSFNLNYSWSCRSFRSTGVLWSNWVHAAKVYQNRDRPQLHLEAVGLAEWRKPSGKVELLIITQILPFRTSLLYLVPPFTLQIYKHSFWYIQLFQGLFASLHTTFWRADTFI